MRTSLRKSLSRWVVTTSLALGVTGVALTAAPETAWAQEPSAQDIAQARQLGQQAQAAHDAGNFAEAEKLWGAAQKLYPVAPTLGLGAARAQMKLGKYVAASENYNKIIREWGNNPSPPPAFKDALDAARAEVGAATAKIASVTISVDGPTNPTVTIDGQNVPAAALGLKRPVDPGTHTVKASAEGWKPAEATFQVAEAGNADAKLKLEKMEGQPPPVGPVGPQNPQQNTDPINPPPPGGDTKSGGNKTLAIVAFGVGGAGLVVGTITGLMAVGKHGDLKDKCPDGKCTSEQQGDVDSYKTVGTISTVGFIVAGVGAAAGLVLLFTGGKASAQTGGSHYATAKKPETKPTITPYLGLGAAGVTGRF